MPVGMSFRTAKITSAPFASLPPLTSPRQPPGPPPGGLRVAIAGEVRRLLFRSRPSSPTRRAQARHPIGVSRGKHMRGRDYVKEGWTEGKTAPGSCSRTDCGRSGGKTRAPGEYESPARVEERPLARSPSQRAARLAPRQERTRARRVQRPVTPLGPLSRTRLPDRGHLVLLARAGGRGVREGGRGAGHLGDHHEREIAPRAPPDAVRADLLVRQAGRGSRTGRTRSAGPRCPSRPRRLHPGPRRRPGRRCDFVTLTEFAHRAAPVLTSSAPQCARMHSSRVRAGLHSFASASAMARATDPPGPQEASIGW